MDRGELEAAIWRAMKAHQVTCPGPVQFVDAILRLAAQHAATDFDASLTPEARAAAIAERRAALDPVLTHKHMIMALPRARVAAAFGVSVPTVVRWRRRIRQEGSP